MFKAFLTLFSEANIWFYLLFIASTALFIVEVLVIKNILTRMAGILLVLGTIAVRCSEKNITANEIIFYMIYIILLVMLIVGIVKIVKSVYVVRKKARSFTIIDGNKVPLTPEGNPDYSFLLGKEGEVVADLKPTGKARIQGCIYEVTATNEYIYNGSLVYVEKVVAQKIMVKKI